MSVAIFITNESEARCLIPWGIQFASAEHTDLLLLCPRKSKGKVAFEDLGRPTETSTTLHREIFSILDQQDPELVVLKQDISSGSESSDHDRVVIATREIVAPDPESYFVDQSEELGIQLLLMPVFEPVRGTQEQKSEWEERLFDSAPWGVICLRGSVPSGANPIRILFASEGDEDPDDEFGLENAARLGRMSQGSVTLLYVRPMDDVVAAEIARKHVDHLERSIQHRKLEVHKKIELADSLAEGINRQPLEQFDLIVVGTRRPKEIRRLLSQLRSLEDERQAPLAIMRRAVPLTDRVWTRFKASIRSVVPQIDREHRVNLVDRLSTSSNFDFDFMALISLSTLIAALGLALNSSAVVIGAMLVAPLMTPLVGIGLALVQGNERLIKSAVKSVLLGFSVALLIGIGIGFFLRVTHPSFEISQEMLSRGSPNLLDLIVALASGVAAAYAMGRPHLISALPGVAIAAALVPPIATSGLAFSMFNLTLAAGACLLFFTNIIAIALGTAITFWAVGISTFVDAKDSTRTVQTWPRYVFLGFVLISFLLAVFMEIDQFSAAAERNADAAGSNVEAIFGRSGPSDPGD